ncbi:MAG: tetratricopeptide repeat-containing sensor histidine kinase, partial [Ignavibacteriota bacterium]
HITILLFISASFICRSDKSDLSAQTNLEVFNKSINNLPSQNKIDVILDSAKKYFNTDIVRCIAFSELAISNLDDKITDEYKADVYSKVSGYYFTSGNYSKALEYILIDLRILENNPGVNVLKIGRCYVNIGEIYRATTDYDNALLNLNKSVSIFTDLKNDEGEKGLSNSYERIAAVYFELSYKIDSALVIKSMDYANKSLGLSEKYKINSRKISCWNILGACQIMNENYDKALELFNMALNESYRDSAYSDRSNILNNIASCYIKIEDYNKAIEYAQMSYDESKKRGVLIYVREASFFLYKSYLELRQFEKVIFYLDEYNKVSLELFSNDKNRAVESLEQKYRKEKIDEEHRDEKNNLIFLSVGLFIVFVFLMVIFFMRHKALKFINKELEHKNKTITAQKAELEEVNAMKNKFFSILAHDLRNPFNGILGFLDILHNSYDTLSYEEKKQFIGYIHTSANQVFKLLDRLLQLSRLQEGRYQFNNELVDVKDLTEQIIKLQDTNARSKRVSLKLRIFENVFVNADKTSLDIILRNLIDNAIKFTSAGGEVVISSGSNNGNVEIIVSDTGVGMDQKDSDSIFRLDKKTVSIGTNNEKGTGLGLAVCKELIDKMNGKINVESIIGKGSKFILTFPSVEKKS